MTLENVAILGFLLGMAWAVYAYCGYPLALLLIRLARGRRGKELTPSDDRPPPHLTVIVAVHNGASQIRDKIENLLAATYPRHLVAIVVADDASTDGTDKIVSSEFASRGVRLIRLGDRGGKERAQMLAVSDAKGDIIVFTDVGLRMDRRGLLEIVRPFEDPSVGCVSSVDRVADVGGAESGEGFYVRYEMFLRRLEEEVSSLVGVSGSFFAIRRDLCSDFVDTLPSDFRCVLVTVKAGLRAVTSERAVGYYADITAGRRSRERRVRTIVRGLATLLHHRDMLNPISHGLFAWQLWSHKVARWTVPFGLILALISSSYLSTRSWLFTGLLAAQVALYLYGSVVLYRPDPPTHLLGKLVRFLSEANVAALIAWIRFARGERIVLWKPTAR